MNPVHVGPWPQDASVHPACEIRSLLTSRLALDIAGGVLASHGYRVSPDGVTGFTAVLGGRLRAEWLEALIGFAPARGPFQHVVIEVEAVDGTLRLTCRNGFRQVGAPRRVAALVTEIASALGREAGDVEVSAWRTNPPWAPAWPRPSIG